MNSLQDGKLFNNDTEIALLYCLLIYSEETKIYLPEIKDDFFFSHQNREIFKNIVEMIEQGEKVDLVSIKNRVEIKKTTLMQILNSTGLLSSIRTYISILKRYADKRWFLEQSNKTKEDDGDIKKSMSKFAVDIINRIKNRDNEDPSVKNIIREFEKYQDENKKHIASGNEYIGIPTGFPSIDKAINGVRKGHYWIVTAYNNTGKSYFLLNIANRMLNENKRVLYFSLEMNRVQNIARLLGIRTKIDPTIIEQGSNQGDNLIEETKEKGELYSKDLTLYTTKRHIGDIMVTIYAEQSIKPIDCIMIDYIQKIQGDDNRYERYTHSSDMIQKISQEIQVPIIVASQVDNQTARSKSTEIVATKGSGDIANDADFAILLQKSEEESTVECFIQKNRHGMKGGCQLKFSDGGNLRELDTLHT